ncbi:hypothetical protein [Streptomyces justiciae]|uniref:hypothetical protein n=1 Tax=Streptomyces justiciae TaxID=2780140 RepID=UPI002118FD60|nr:hypothetical protein [Streptomyces justiciae]MCW8379766.1 hypothetical protein [Streptomyces justiciae]
MKKNEITTFLLAAVAGTIAVVGLTILIYGTFFQDYLERFNELSDAEMDIIERDNQNFVWFIVANLAHGFLIATVIRWGKFYAPLRGGVAAATVAFLTEVYFLFTQHMLFRTMSLESAILDTLMWTFINIFVGALVAWILGRKATVSGRLAETGQG